MVDFAQSAATARRLIDANGRTVSVVKVGSTPADVNKPWDLTGAVGGATVTGKAVFVDPASLGSMISDVDNIARSQKVALFAAANDGGNDLSTFDEVVDGGSSWRIVGAKLLQPADTRVLYVFGLER